jgi:hypothetical protein
MKKTNQFIDASNQKPLWQGKKTHLSGVDHDNIIFLSEPPLL